MKPTALITGASSGLGRAIAEKLASEGYEVILHGRDIESLRVIAEALHGRYLVGNLNEPQEISRIRNQITSAPDILVNCAAQLADGTFWETPEKVFEEVFRVNFLSPVGLIRSFLPEIRERGTGIFVNISSGVARRGLPFASAYSASKAALQVFSESLRVELHGSGIRVITLSPGPMKTALHHKAHRFGRSRAPMRGNSPHRIAEILWQMICRGQESRTLGIRARLAAWLNLFSPRLTDWLVAKTSI